jgi:peptidyl-dipeptidase A
MWAQQWSNIYPLLEPYKGVASLDVTSSLKKLREQEFQRLKAEKPGAKDALEIAELSTKADAAMSVKMTRMAEDFYVSLGMQKLPDSFWQKSLLTRPRDRDVVCHASAWDMNMKGDVRIKQCIEPDEESLITI